MIRTYWPLFLMSAPFALILIGIIYRQFTLPREGSSGAFVGSQFDIYTRSNGEKKAIKRGWSWPAFFFSWVWAFCTQLWFIGFLLLIASAIFTISFSVIGEYQHSTSETTKNIGGALALAWLAMRIMLGAYGNAWKRKRLERKLFQRIATVNKSGKNEALATKP